MALILAIEPDPRQASQLADLIRGRLSADLVHADTTEGALTALASVGDRVPDLVLVPSLLSAQEDAAIAGALRVIATAANVRMLTIPVLAQPEAPPVQRGVFARFRRAAATRGQGCDPAVFADQIAAYLAEAAAERRALEADDEFAEAAARVEEVSAPPAGSDTIAPSGPSFHDVYPSAAPADEGVSYEPESTVAAPLPPLFVLPTTRSHGDTHDSFDIPGVAHGASVLRDDEVGSADTQGNNVDAHTGPAYIETLVDMRGDAGELAPPPPAFAALASEPTIPLPLPADAVGESAPDRAERERHVSVILPAEFGGAFDTVSAEAVPPDDLALPLETFSAILAEGLDAGRAAPATLPAPTFVAAPEPARVPEPAIAPAPSLSLEPAPAPEPAFVPEPVLTLDSAFAAAPETALEPAVEAERAPNPAVEAALAAAPELTSSPISPREPEPEDAPHVVMESQGTYASARDEDVQLTHIDLDALALQEDPSDLPALAQLVAESAASEDAHAHIGNDPEPDVLFIADLEASREEPRDLEATPFVEVHVTVDSSAFALETVAAPAYPTHEVASGPPALEQHLSDEAYQQVSDDAYDVDALLGPLLHELAASREHLVEDALPVESVASVQAPVEPSVEPLTVARAVPDAAAIVDDIDPMFFADDVQDDVVRDVQGEAPRAATPERQAWVELIHSLRQDIERLKAERGHGAGPSAPVVSPASGSGAKADGASRRYVVTSAPDAAGDLRVATPRRRVARPAQDQWGLFDPEQCGFAALRAKLDEISVRDEVSA